MSVPILCLVALCFMCWVMVLKAENTDLKNEIEKLRGKKKAKEALSEIHIDREASSWGKKNPYTSD